MSRKVMAFALGFLTLAAGYMAGRANTVRAITPEDVVPQPQPTAVLRVTPVQQMGQQLMECRLKLVAVACIQKGPQCVAAQAGVTGDGIFEALRGAEERLDWLDVVVRVDEELARCKARLGEDYVRKVVTVG